MSEQNIPALDALQAVMLVTKHLDTLLPFLLALRRVPKQLPQRIGLLQSIACDIANSADFAKDWYEALTLLSGEDLSNTSVAQLLSKSVELLSNDRVGDIWRVAFDIGLLDESLIQKWVVFEGLTRNDNGDAAKAED